MGMSSPFLFPSLSAGDLYIPSHAFTGGEIELREPWAQELSGLWQIQPWDFEREKEYNAKMARKKPHCSICYLFYQPSQRNQVGGA